MKVLVVLYRGHDLDDPIYQRRLEDKIRHLCMLSTKATDDNAWLILSELRLLVRQHIERLRMVAAGKLPGARGLTERRTDRRPPRLP